MSLFTLQSVGFDYGGHAIFDELTLTVNAGERYGLVGVNGAGKSTLLRLIHGQLDASRGRVERASRVAIGYLEQDTELRSEQGLRDAVRYEAFGDLLEVERRLHEVGELLVERGDDPDLLEEYGRLNDRFEQADGYTMDSRTDAALMGLGFGSDRFDQPVNTLSGGQKRRPPWPRSCSRPSICSSSTSPPTISISRPASGSRRTCAIARSPSSPSATIAPSSTTRPRPPCTW